jgi:hypothetical protein
LRAGNTNIFFYRDSTTIQNVVKFKQILVSWLAAKEGYESLQSIIFSLLDQHSVLRQNWNTNKEHHDLQKVLHQWQDVLAARSRPARSQQKLFAKNWRMFSESYAP